MNLYLYFRFYTCYLVSPSSPLGRRELYHTGFGGIRDKFDPTSQPQYAQSVSNLQLNCIAAAKDTIQSMVSAHRVFASNENVPPVVTPPYTDEFVKQSNEITENIVKAVRINNQLTVNAINAAAENFRTLNRTIESVKEYNTNAAKVWNSFVTVQQQPFLHKQ